MAGGKTPPAVETRELRDAEVSLPIKVGFRDAFHWYCHMDKATTVAALRAGIIDSAVAERTTRAVLAVIEAGENQATRPTDYLDIQAMLLREGGAEISRMHSGRSRQDMLATLHRLLLRDRVLAVLKQVNEVRAAMLELGERHADTLVPAYTNGVQAQPVTFGHLMSGYEAALCRSAQRVADNYERLNLSPLGAAALATSRFPVDRSALAALMGFDGCVENAFDAAQLAVIDVGVEVAQVAALIALSVGTFIQDLHAQFHHARNWIFIDDASLLSPSTLMPQKRNPVVLNRARLLASEVVGASMSATLAAHNVCSGMTDYKRYDAARSLDLTLSLTKEVLDILRGIRIDADAAKEEIDLGYSTASELAATLQEMAGVPLAVGHRFASLLVDTARRDRRIFAQIPFSEVLELYDRATTQLEAELYKRFPLTEHEFRAAVDAETMVVNYRGLGGSSPGEVRRMLGAGKKKLEEDAAWRAARVSSLAAAEDRLESAFALLTVEEAT